MSTKNRGTNPYKDKPHKCPEDGCKSSYSRESMLKVHMRKHTGERPYVCNFSGCSSSYTNSSHLKRHMCVVHENSQETTCPEEGCGLVFSNKYSLKKHQNNKHKTGSTEFHCAICSQGFKKKRQLKRHVFWHKDPETPFKCSICNLAFSELHLFNKHNRNHKTYTCDCGIVFNKWSLFCEHRRTSCKIQRIDHKCIICNKVFTTKTNLKCHAMTHIEESQIDVHRCPYINCNRSYKYKKNLNAHVATVHEKCDRSVECYQCGQILKSKRILVFHIAKVHTHPKKRKSKRAPRKDKGIPKKCMAAVASGIEIPLKDHSSVLKSADPDTSNALLNERDVPLVLNDNQENSLGVHDGDETLDCDVTEAENNQLLINEEGNETEMGTDQLLLNEEENETEAENNLLIDEETNETTSALSSENTLNEDFGESNKIPTQTDAKVIFTEQNLQPDELLLTICDGILKNIQDQLDKLPNDNVVF